MIVRIFTLLGSFASLVALIFAVRPQGQPITAGQGILLGIAMCFLVVTLALEILNYRKAQPVTMTTDSEIRDYMFRWISRGGRIAIFSRDLSWVRDDAMKGLLLSKARQNELCICVPDAIPLAAELRDTGAEVYTYPELGYVPQSRFTIINLDRADAQVAVGGKSKSKHVVREFGVGEHPFFFVANDLVNLVKKFNKWKVTGNTEPKQ